jgi:flagellar biosynthesis protein FlhB
MSDQKTEQPTQRRLEKARREGQFPMSREFVAAVQFLVFVWLLQTYAGSWFQDYSRIMRTLVAEAFRPELTAARFTSICWTAVLKTLGPFLLIGAGGMVITLAAQLFATRLGISLTKLAPDLKRMNPISRLKELPRRNLPAFLQALVLLPLFGFAVWAIAKENIDVYARLPLASAQAGSQQLANSLVTLLWRAGSLFLLFGIVDLFRQRRRFARDLRMTKQEIRDEVKETEGNPLIKQRIRRLQRDLARRSMMKEVPRATAVIVNPTHYSVAIRYSLDSIGAPVVVAKGKNYLARRIREIANEHNVPIIENQPLAQALYKAVDIGQEIPAHLYRAVAEILAYIFKLMNGRLPG